MALNLREYPENTLFRQEIPPQNPYKKQSKMAKTRQLCHISGYIYVTFGSLFWHFPEKRDVGQPESEGIPGVTFLGKCHLC